MIMKEEELKPAIIEFLKENIKKRRRIDTDEYYDEETRKERIEELDNEFDNLKCIGNIKIKDIEKTKLTYEQFGIIKDLMELLDVNILSFYYQEKLKFYIQNEVDIAEKEKMENENGSDSV